MKATTTWAFRNQHLNQYPESYFKTDWDYFLYLHLNDLTRQSHVIGALVALVLFPWACYEVIMNWNFIPLLIYTFFYYGIGFLSHYAWDGTVSKTSKDFWKAYKYAVKINILSLRGKYKNEEVRFCAAYPETLWIYKLPEAE